MYKNNITYYKIRFGGADKRDRLTYLLDIPIKDNQGKLSYGYEFYLSGSSEPHPLLFVADIVSSGTAIMVKTDDTFITRKEFHSILIEYLKDCDKVRAWGVNFP